MADYSSAAGAYAAVGQGIASYITASGQASVARINANSQNAIRAINNETVKVVNGRNEAIGNLQRWAQSVRNDRVYEQVGRTQEAMAINFNRSRDARTRGNFAESIRNAEESGRMAAAAAASGVTGSVVDILDQTNILKQNMKRIARVEAEDQIAGDYSKMEIEQRFAILDQLDNSLIFDPTMRTDFGVTQPVATANPFSAAIAGMGIKGMQQIGTSVGNGSFFNFGASSEKDALGFPVNQ